MKNLIWTAASLKAAINADLPEDFRASKVEFNSKDVKLGDIFIALSGGGRDGHEFVDDAFSRGAALAICSQKIENPKVIQVADTYDALLKLAKYNRTNSKAKFIGVTGSVGKTSTKEAIASIFNNFGKCYYNQGSFNNHLGVPLSLASVPQDADFSVNEMGMNHAGEIRELTRFVKPDIAVITQLGEAHLEQLGSLENICKAKCEIFDGLASNGIAIINADNPYFAMQKQIAESLNIKNLFSFGENEGLDCFIKKYEKNLDYNLVVYDICGKIYETRNRLIGKHQAVNIGAALLCAYALELDMDIATKAVENISAYYGRGVEINLKIANHAITIIDDAYNANPTSLKAALASLADRPGKKIAILADMRELGENAAKLHADMAEFVIKSGVTELFSVGILMKSLSDELKNDIIPHSKINRTDGFSRDLVSSPIKDRLRGLDTKNPSVQFNFENGIRTRHYESTNEEVFADIFNKIKDENSTILVKGSKSTLIRSFVDYIKNKADLLEKI